MHDAASLNHPPKFDFQLMLNNEEFDNDDNPYGQFMLHMYTNMNDISDTIVD